MTPCKKLSTKIATATCLALLLFAAGCTIRTGTDAPQRLSVMTYNIRIGAGGGEWPSDPSKINLQPVIDLLAAQNPDIAGLEEVDQFRKRSGLMDQPAVLREGLKCNVAFAEAYSVPTGTAHEEKYGVALLAKDKLLPQARFPLFKPDYSKSHPEYPDYFSEQRVLLYARVVVGGRQVHVFVTHLGLTQDQRQEQIKQIAEITARYHGPKLLMGDFNAEPTEPALQLLERDFQDVLTATRTSVEDRKSFPAGAKPRMAIDYILASREFRVMSAKVIRDETLASDHNPVMADLELPPIK